MYIHAYHILCIYIYIDVYVYIYIYIYTFIVGIIVYFDLRNLLRFLGTSMETSAASGDAAAPSVPSARRVLPPAPEVGNLKQSSADELSW